MKRTVTNSILILFAIIMSMSLSSMDEKGKVHLKVIKEENGEKSVFEKVYKDMEALKADAELKYFDVLVKDWADDHSKGIVIKNRIDLDKGYKWVIDEDGGTNEGEKHIVIKHKDGEEKHIKITKENVIRIKTDNGEQNITMKIEGDGEHTMVWIDEDGNKTELTEEKIEQIIKEHDGEKEIQKTIKIISSDDGEHNVFIMKGDGDHTTEIEAEITKEIGEDGEEKIVKKKVWITKDGKKVELDDESAYEFTTEGNNITIKIDDETLDLAGFSEGNLEDNDLMVSHKEGDEGVKQTMNINIEEKNGEQFIEIKIKRTNSLNVTISEILKDDTSIEGIDYSLKNNLKPSQLNYYPNPNHGKFNLKFILDRKEQVTVKVMDISGREVYKETLMDFSGTYDNQLDLTGKEKGLYILQVSQKKKMLTRKILIE